MTSPSLTEAAVMDKDKEKDSILFGSMTPPLTTLQRAARVKKLVLKDAYEFHARLEAFLDVFPTLTTLTLDGLIKGPLRIDILLASCPCLKSLSVEYVLSDFVFWGPPSPRSIANQHQPQSLGESILQYINQPFVPPPPPQRRYGLQTLILRHAISSQAVIQSMLQALPSLLSLEIRFLKIPNSHLVNPGFFDRPAFFRALSGSCPNLQHLHFSIFQRLLLVTDSMAMCEALPTLTGLGFPCQDLESFRQPTWTGETGTSGFGPDAPRLGVLEFYVNHLTRLELLAYRYLQEDSLISNLHAFLTEAVHLRHLVAPKVNYWTEFLEMKVVHINNNGAGVPFIRTTADGQDQYQHQHQATAVMSAAAGATGSGGSLSQWAASKTKTWGWACRNLETLHLGFKAKEGYTLNSHSNSGTGKHVVEEESRILFGFISRNCRHLRDLHIRKYSLDLSLEGGFCLLTQLRELERLVIWSQTKGLRLRERDVDWIGYSGADDAAVVDVVAAEQQQQEMPALKETNIPVPSVVDTLTTTTKATSTPASESTTTIATEAGAETRTETTDASKASTTTPAITVSVHDATVHHNSAYNNTNNNNSNISASTINIISPNNADTKESKHRLKSFFRRLSSSSSSSIASTPSPPSNIRFQQQQPQQPRRRQQVLIIQKHLPKFYTNMPSPVVTVFKTDDD
ncbi:hypothetical protein BG015_001066, partial [Linnemannia schmuckeri]